MIQVDREKVRRNMNVFRPLSGKSMVGATFYKILLRIEVCDRLLVVGISMCRAEDFNVNVEDEQN